MPSPDVLYPYYEKGQFDGVPDNLSPSAFYELVLSASSFMKFTCAYCNGELICVFEERPMPGLIGGIQYEVHANWLTKSKRKRVMTLDKYLEERKGKNLVTLVHPDEADGHFGFVERGKMRYMGEDRNMHEFRSV